MLITAEEDAIKVYIVYGPHPWGDASYLLRSEMVTQISS